MKNNTNTYDILIIGAGPAGMTAAIYAKRAEAKIAMVEKGAPGGKVVKTSEVENYPGFDSILGPDLAMKMFMQTQNLQVPYLGQEVTEIVKCDGYFEVRVKNQEPILAKAVIVATGTVERKIGVPGEISLYGKGVSYCAVCDGAFYKNKNVAVVGGGYAALEEAMYLTKFVNKVYLIHRRQGFRAEAKVVEKMQANAKIELVLDAVVHEIQGTDKVTGVVYQNVIDKSLHELQVDAVFPYIGADPISQFVEGLGVCDDHGYIKVDNRCATSIPGLFAAGDVTDTSLRQIATAVSDGAKAAQFAIEYLDHLD